MFRRVFHGVFHTVIQASEQQCRIGIQTRVSLSQLDGQLFLLNPRIQFLNKDVYKRQDYAWCEPADAGLKLTVSEGMDQKRMTSAAIPDFVDYQIQRGEKHEK